MNSNRATAAVAGVFFIVAAVAAIIGLALYQPLLNDPGYVTSRYGSDTQVLWGAFFEVLVVASVVGTAVTLFPVVKRWNEGIAIGYVAGRTVEGVIIAAGIISVITVVTLRHDFGGATGADATAAVAVGRSLVAIHNWTFLFGPNLALGFNTTMLASLMYRSRLVPRLIPVLGLIGGPLIFISGLGVLFGFYTQVSAFAAVTALPVFAWEMSLAAWMIVKGFSAGAVLTR